MCIRDSITVAEPDLQVLAHQFTAAEDIVIILTVAAGVGAFLVLAVLRQIFGFKLRTLLIIFYTIVFVLSFFVKPEFLPV